MASFLQQFGIRLQYEYDSIKCVEFNQLLKSLNGDTPLGYVVGIRAERDQKKIKEMTAQEKEIRRKWQDFIREKEKKEKQNKLIFIKKEDISKIFSKMFS